ncbi:ABC transporter ATP-binding protein [Paenibacillus phyllosphaerae]|nr:ABC transporter ATP-binding protein [Paenibacillus phyllosphaerae]
MHEEEHRYSPYRVIVRLLRLGKPYLVLYILIAVAILVEVGLSIAYANTFQLIVSGVVSDEYPALVRSILIMSVIVVSMSAVFMARGYLGARLDNDSRLKLQDEMLRKVSRVRLDSLDKLHTSDKIARILESASIAQAGINNRLIGFIADAAKVVALLVYLSSLSARLTAGSIIVSALIPLMLLPISRYSRRWFDQQNRLSAEKDGIVQEAVQGGEVVRSYRLQKDMNERFANKVSEFVRVRLRTLSIESFTGSLTAIVPFLSVVYILGYGGLLVSRNEMEVGAVAAFLAASNLLTGPIYNLFGTWNALQWSISQAKRVFELMDLPEEPSGSGVAEEPKHDGVNLESAGFRMEKVVFRYSDEDLDVVRGVSLSLEEGRIAAIVGPSGSGKSTMLKLFMKDYEPSSGRIWWNGIDCSLMDNKQWRKKLALVSQTPFLFHGTVYDNIHYGNREASELEVIEAAKMANIHDVIMRLPDGYHTRIGERGATLSGGERQRITIARAFLRNPDILLLDEPTSALDNENQAAIQQAINRLMKGKTCVIVAHRLSTIIHADKIIFMKDGAVVEAGTHEELMLLGGHYYEMYQMNRTNEQSEWEVAT